MNKTKRIELTKKQIRQALKDYFSVTSTNEEIYDNVSDTFVDRLAEDSVEAKQPLRELFSQSPVWNEDLDAIVINGTRTHDKDCDTISNLFWRLFRPYEKAPVHEGSVNSNVNVVDAQYCAESARRNVIRALNAPFVHAITEENQNTIWSFVNYMVPGAYAPGKKLSKVLRSICQAFGLVDDTKGSDFQRTYAMIADELTAKQIDFKLFVSINPAHFLTMSNPKGDCRGQMMTSCHSFNSTEYTYNNGCSGYARDPYTFIVFTVEDPTEAQNLNNRKLTRQVFAYRPGSGMLLQSRLYLKAGGVYDQIGADQSQCYRDLIQRELSDLEHQPNLWKTKPSHTNTKFVFPADAFGGYADWIYDSFNCNLSFRADCDKNCVEPMVIGAPGLCIKCGEECGEGLYCEDCDKETCRCDHCGGTISLDDAYTVYVYGSEETWCRDCYEDDSYYCENCDRSFSSNEVVYINDLDCYYCYECASEHAWCCDRCGDWCSYDEGLIDICSASDDVSESICSRCFTNNSYRYFQCEDCGQYFFIDNQTSVATGNDDTFVVCPSCAQTYHYDTEGDFYYDNDFDYEAYKQERNATKEVLV